MVNKDGTEITASTVLGDMGTLGQDVGTSVENASAAVGDVVKGAGTAVADTVATVKGAFASLRHAFDLREHVRRHPCLMMGGAALLGYLIGNLLHRTRRASD